LACLVYRLLCGLVRLLARRGGERELEIVVLRHQLAVSPQTLRRWHRALLQGNRGRRGRRPGRPTLAAETRSLILRLARENPRWGYMRIQGELLKLGISVSATTIASVLRVPGRGPAPRRIGPSCSEFLRAQAWSMFGAGLPAEPGGGLEGNASARSAATPEG
jgi:Homeodomain-like domain